MAKKVLLATEKPFATSARDQVVSILKDANYEVLVLESYKDKGELLHAVAGVHAMIVRSDLVDASVLEAAKDLSLVVRAGAGYDNIDCTTARKRGVDAMNTPGQNANGVAELAFGLMLQMARAKYTGKMGSELRGKRLGLHAMGAVGRAVATIAKGFGMTVRAYDPFIDTAKIRDQGVEPVALIEDLYRLSDYVSLHMPANAETKNTIGHKLLSLMPKNACLVNTARKEVVNESELLRVFEERADLRYVSDVAPDAAALAVLQEKYADRVFFTAKKSGAQTNEANVNAGLAAARQIVSYFEKGSRDYIVNP